MIGAEWIYWLAGGFFLGTGIEIALDAAHPRRVANAAFWLLLGGSFFYASFLGALPAWLLGVAVIAMALIAGFGLTSQGAIQRTTPAERAASAQRKGDVLFVPSLAIPVVTVLFAVGVSKISLSGRPLLAHGQETLVGLGVAVLVALALGIVLLRPDHPVVALREGRRLLEAVGWAVLLPQMLAVLGGVFTLAGVGTEVGALASRLVPADSRFLAVVAYAAGMAVFTIIMGNAFAAFPIMTAAVGWPVLVQRFGAHPAPLFAIGMLAGYCGTLCTPMAANFNLVPPALLEMHDRYRQIKVQIPTAAALFCVNVALLATLPFA